MSKDICKKAFDPTVCFMFFGSWLKTIEKLETEQDKKSIAYSLFKAIAEYSMYEIDPDFSDHPTLNAFWEMFEKEIDLSVANRQRGFAKDEMNEKYKTIIQAVVDNPDMSLRDIGALTGTDKEMVRRVKKKYAKEIQERIDRCAVVDDCSFNSLDNTVDCDTDCYTVNDGIRQDTDKTARQEFIYDEDMPF